MIEADVETQRHRNMVIIESCKFQNHPAIMQRHYSVIYQFHDLLEDHAEGPRISLRIPKHPAALLNPA